jgi:hypothetical protein
MKDTLIPLGLLLFLALFAFAIIFSARAQRNTKSAAFRDFAEESGLDYLEQDDGRARDFARDFDGIGRFTSSSLGEVIPNDVVSGKLKGADAILFRHRIRHIEGWAREWFACGITGGEFIANRCAVQFFPGFVERSTIYLQDPIAKERKIGTLTVVVRSSSVADAGKLGNENTIKQLARLVSQMSFVPEIQVIGNRVIAYQANRNESIDASDRLRELFEFTRDVVHV